jgi:hypothetical protein
MRISTYKSVLTGFKTQLVVRNNKKFTQGRIEGIIMYNNRKFEVILTDGYKYLTGFKYFNTLKESITYIKGEINGLK